MSAFGHTPLDLHSESSFPLFDLQVCLVPAISYVCGTVIALPFTRVHGAAWGKRRVSVHHKHSIDSRTAFARAPSCILGTRCT